MRAIFDRFPPTGPGPFVSNAGPFENFRRENRIVSLERLKRFPEGDEGEVTCTRVIAGSIMISPGEVL